MRRALVFAHWDPHGRVDEYVVRSLAVYRQHFELIHFVSTAGLDAAEAGRAALLCDRVILRENVGHDFLSWRVGFAALPPQVPFDAVVFANDSVYGPSTPMPAFWARVEALDADLWGATANEQHARHVQSFFMGFGRRLLASGFAARFWDAVEPIEDKLQLISELEVGLTRLVEAEGFRAAAVVELTLDAATRAQIVADNRPDEGGEGAAALILGSDTLNPMQLGWARSLEGGCPFVKVELLRDNLLGANISRAVEWLRRSHYDVGLIARHLGRTAAAGALPGPERSCGRMRRGAVPGVPEPVRAPS